jgi:hypothetical protein
VNNQSPTVVGGFMTSAICLFRRIVLALIEKGTDRDPQITVVHRLNNIEPFNRPTSQA